MLTLPLAGQDPLGNLDPPAAVQCCMPGEVRIHLRSNLVRSRRPQCVRGLDPQRKSTLILPSLVRSIGLKSCTPLEPATSTSASLRARTHGQGGGGLQARIGGPSRQLRPPDTVTLGQMMGWHKQGGQCRTSDVMAARLERISLLKSKSRLR